MAVIGNSLGGAVAQRLAADQPERVAKLVLVASAGFGRGVTYTLRLLSVPGVGEALLTPSRASAEELVRSLFHDPRFVTPERSQRSLELSRQPGAQRAFLHALRALGSWRGVRYGWRRHLARRLAERPVPMLVVWGDQDQVLPARHLKRVRRLYPHARTHRFRETGHAPQLERSEAFNQLVLAFLAAPA